MGCFGYICKGCGTQIVGDCFTGGEKCVMIHVRQGKELGRVEGHYDEYGGVIEQKELQEVDKFRGNSDSINGHKEICCSELRQADSYCKVIERKQYGEQQVDYYQYVGKIIQEEILDNIQDVRKSRLYKYINQQSKEQIEGVYSEGKNDVATIFFSLGLEDLRYNRESELFKEFASLPDIKLDSYSGIVAWHSVCYDKASEKERNDLTPSESDPNQSWGEVRDKYC